MIDKASQNEVSRFTVGNIEDPVAMSCDRGTNDRDAIWAFTANSRAAYSFAVPNGACGVGGSATPFAPPCRDTDGNGNVDNDGDGLCDNWETEGIDADNDGTIDLVLYDDNGDGTIDPTERPNINRKDIYYESDFMLEHRPANDAMDAVKAAFAAAPGGGIAFHGFVDELIPHSNLIALNGCEMREGATAPRFSDLKSPLFRSCRRTGKCNDLSCETIGVSVRNLGTPNRFERRWWLRGNRR